MYNDPISLTQKLISFPSVTPIDAGITDFLIECLSNYNFKCTKLIFDDVTNLYARFGNNGPNFCFAGHTDVVPTGNNWSFDPFIGTMKDGMLYGRGTSDMKAAVAASMIASIEFVKAYNFNGSISFLITGDEEAKAENGTVKVLEYLDTINEKIDACIVGEPTCPEILGDMIKYGRRGSVSFDLIVKGTQGHVAYPHLADNPINHLLKILTELKSIKLDQGNEDFMASNLEITNIEIGNLAGNVIPGQAKATFNIRFNNCHTKDSLIKLVQTICDKFSHDFELNSHLGAECFVNSKNSDLVSLLKESVKQITGIEPVLSTTGGTSDARFLKNYTQVIEFGLINKTAHKIDEHVSIEDIIKLKEIYFSFLERFFKVK
ncbi:MAG: succinyl-diaminopimelate desuccinylase [Pseudomonadota bacterium]